MVDHGRVVLTPLISEDDLQCRMTGLAEQIARDTKHEQLIVIGLLKGSFVFLADMVRILYRHRMRMVVDFMIVSSYGAATESAGKIRILRDITTDIAEHHVLLVDDILDSGRTMAATTGHLLGMRPASLRTCVLLDKPARRAVSFEADYSGFTIPDEFVVGYGLDYENHYRELPHIATISA